MAIERTLCIIKPDAVEKRKAGAILQHLLEEGFNVLGLRQQQLSQREAEGFYAVHRERPFFKDLCEFMTQRPGRRRRARARERGRCTGAR